MASEQTHENARSINDRVLTILKEIKDIYMYIDLKLLYNDSKTQKLASMNDKELVARYHRFPDVIISNSDVYKDGSIECVINTRGHGLWVPRWLLEELRTLGDPTATYNLDNNLFRRPSLGGNDEFCRYHVDHNNLPPHIPDDIKQKFQTHTLYNNDNEEFLYGDGDRTNPYLIDYIKKNDGEKLQCGGMTLCVVKLPKDLSLWSKDNDDSMWSMEYIKWNTSKIDIQPIQASLDD